MSTSNAVCYHNYTHWKRNPQTGKARRACKGCGKVEVSMPDGTVKQTYV